MDIKSFFKRLSDQKHKTPVWGEQNDLFERYYDKKAEVFCIGYVPAQIKGEALALIEGKLGNKTRFNREYIDSLGLSVRGRELFDAAFSQFLYWTSKLFVSKKRKKSQSLHPWQCAVIIVPSLSFNAWTNISFDEKVNTALIYFNIGVLLENLDRLQAVFSVPGFLEAQRKKEIPVVVPFAAKSGALCNLSGNIIYQEIAVDISIKASMMVLFHEFAHFLRGHTGYIRGELTHSEAIYQAPAPGTGKGLDDTTRRIMEFDADQMAGVLASQFWRLFDHPVVAPESERNETFFMVIISSVISNNLILGQYGFTNEYYSPVWRIQHTLEMFYQDAVGVDKALSSVEKRKYRECVSQKFHSYQQALLLEFECAYKMLGLGPGLSYERVPEENSRLLDSDLEEHARLTLEFKRYMPSNFCF